MGTQFAEDSAVFYLEMLFRIVVQNRDRILSFWSSVKQHLIDIISTSTTYSRLLERAVTGLLRLGVRLLHREDLQQPVLQSLQILLLISPRLIPKLYRLGFEKLLFRINSFIRIKILVLHFSALSLDLCPGVPLCYCIFKAHKDKLPTESMKLFKSVVLIFTPLKIGRLFSCS